MSPAEEVIRDLLLKEIKTLRDRCAELEKQNRDLQRKIDKVLDGPCDY